MTFCNLAMATTDDRNAHIIEAFQQILAERDSVDARIATKAEAAEQAQNQQILAVALTYTIDDIVKGLADLQLTFGSDVQVLSDQLMTEVVKLDQLGRAIEVETQHLQELRQIRVVADALHLLTQNHQEQRRALEQNVASQRQALEQEMAAQHQLWQQEQAEFERTVQQQQTVLTKERQRQEADYQYELDRTRTIAANEYEQQQCIQDQDLQDTKQHQDQEWAEREALLADHQSELKTYQHQVEGFPTELEAAVKQARTTAAAEIVQAAQVEADLVEKEWESTQQGYAFQVEALEATIQRQVEQMDALHTQLQDALKQSQALTIKAFENSSKARPLS